MTETAATWWACSQCGTLQEEAPACRRCRFEQLMDVRRSSVRDLLDEIDQRRLDRASGRNRMIGVITGMAVVIACWFIPGFWTLRSHVFAVPFLADQWIAMAAIGVLVLNLLDRREPRTKYPWLASLPPSTGY